MRRPPLFVAIIFEPLLIVAALALIANAALIGVYSIPSASMAPTLQVGDHILVTSFRLPFTSHQPRRGDVIVFRAPGASNEVLVKRVIGTPGDLVDAAEGNIRVGGHTLSEPYLMQRATSGAVEPQIVPQASYFVMGDNRAHSYDSRSWGAVPAGSIIGRVQMVLWSSTEAASLPNANAATRDVVPSARQHRRRIFLPVN